MTQPLKPCGTDAAYKRHLKRRERACTPCRRAHALATALQKDPDWKPKEIPACGTVRAYKRHLRHGEVTDRECCDAWAEDKRDRDRERRRQRRLQTV